MSIRTGSIALLAAALLGASAPAALDEAAYQEARAKLANGKTNRNKHPRAYIDAILDFGNKLYPKRDMEGAQILCGLLFEELAADTPDGRKEDRIDGDVLDAVEIALRKISSKPAVDWLVNVVKSKATNVRARFILARALGSQKDTFNVLVELLEERDPRIQIGAVDGIKEQLKVELQKKVDALVTDVQSGGDQANQVLTAVGKALDEQSASLFKRRCETLAFVMESYLAGWTGKDEVLKSTEEMRAIANGIATEEIKGKVVPLVTAVSDFVDKFVKGVEDVNAVREKVAPCFTVLLRILKEPKRPWEVRIGALEALKTDRQALHAEPMIEALGVSALADGRLKVELMSALGAILGVKEPKTDDPNWWKGALAERRKGTMPGTSGGTTVSPTEFFGLKTKSTRIVFILDTTGSMDFRCTETVLPKKDPPAKKGSDVPTGDEKVAPAEEPYKKKAGEIKKRYDDRKIAKRMDALKREMINTIYYLDPRVSFGVVTYAQDPRNWKPVLVQANWANKLACIQDMDSLSPAGPTNIWDGLENAFRFVVDAKRPETISFDSKGNYVTTVNGADTFFLMTDGNHNVGRFSTDGRDFDEKGFLTEFKKINTLRRIVVNTIILGDTTPGADNQDPIKQKSISLFRSIADASGGSFVHLGE